MTFGDGLKDQGADHAADETRVGDEKVLLLDTVENPLFIYQLQFKRFATRPTY
jgi:hypothetical protein